MSEQLSGEEMLAEAVKHLSQGQLPPEVETPEVEEEAPEVEAPEVEAAESIEEPDDKAEQESRAREDGWVPYEEWKAQGRDPRQWRPAEEYNKRGELLRTPKPDLVAEVTELRKKQDEVARLMAEQMALARKREEEAYRRGQEEARQKALEEAEQAWTVGDKDGYQKALEKAREAEEKARPAQSDPTADPDLVAWQSRNEWFAKGFDEIGMPKNQAVKTFLEYQKAYAMARPGEPLIRSVQYAESKVKELLPDHFAPKAQTPRSNPNAAAVASGSRVAPKSASSDDHGFSQLGAEEQALVRQMVKVTGMSLKDYMKEYNRGKKQ